MPALDPAVTIGVVGAGAMGAGIAQVAAQAGHVVRLHDTRPGAAERAIAGIGKVLARQTERGKITTAAAEAIVGRLLPVAALHEFADCGLVVEAIVEQLEAKRGLFAALERMVAADCVLASNTSSLSITALAAGMQAPERFAGLHFFNPAPLMALVEVVAGLETDPAVVETLSATARAWGKSPVTAQSTPGFIVNRVARPYYGEALRLLHERASDPATIDAILREAGGFRMGPFELMDLVGHDVNFAVTNSVYNAYFQDARYRPSLIQQALVAAGRLGRKSGRGFFEYGDNVAPPIVATEAAAGVAAAQFTGTVNARGPLRLLAPLVERLQAAGVAVTTLPAETWIDVEYLQVDNTVVALTDGRTATAHAAEANVANIVKLDLALDFKSATRVAVARADQCGDAGFALAVGMLQAAGLAVSRLDDVPGLAVMRAVAMLANEAADAVHQGVCSAADCDTAMQKGVSYPRGPLAWADAIGLAAVVGVLDRMHAHYGDDRYRVSPLLRRKLQSGGRFHG
ncbi:MAG: 3-hydroxyacyl-CoA dehydrogenase PaaH [Betaproteobacteria bacterium]